MKLILRLCNFKLFKSVIYPSSTLDTQLLHGAQQMKCGVGVNKLIELQNGRFYGINQAIFELKLDLNQVYNVLVCKILFLAHAFHKISFHYCISISCNMKCINWLVPWSCLCIFQKQ